MYNYKLMIQYDGGRYKGWQRLGDSEATIQGKLERVLSKMAGYELEITGCSRTDAGVHALGQTANFKLKEFIPEEKIMNYMNHYLPEDIAVVDISVVHEEFHARYHAKDKTYLYQIWNGKFSNPFLRKYSMHVNNELNLELMSEAGNWFIGEHDFTAFSNAKSKKKSMVRTIKSIDITNEGGLIQIRIRGDGFLYNMARWMAGTLIEVGAGDKKPEEIPEMLASRQRNRTGFLAEACGLYLEKVSYDE